MSFVQPTSRLLLLILVSTITVSIFALQFFIQREQVNLPNFSTVKFKPRKIGNFLPPSLSVRSVLVVDVDSNTVLFEKNPNLKLAPASLTKLATALVVSQKCLPDQVITVPKMSTPTGTKMGLVSGEKITVENLLYGLLLPSGNDAANVLVSSCFANYEEFLSSITKLTQELGMTNTQFQNPSGLPTKDHFSTAADLAKLAVATLANQKLATIVSTKEKIVFDVNGQISHKLTNLNKLLDNPQVLGVKTGTSVFGENLIILKEVRLPEENRGHKVISIILQSQDRFLETEKILNWVAKNFVWEPVVQVTN